MGVPPGEEKELLCQSRTKHVVMAIRCKRRSKNPSLKWPGGPVTPE
jgi:hypothetical protein